MSGFYANRTAAGRALTPLLERYREADDTIVLGLARGGVPVAREVARMLGLPMDMLVVRKIVAPMAPEFAIGSVASGDIVCLDPDAVEAADLRDHELASLISYEQRELARQESNFRSNRPAADLHGQTVLLVDDGLATGFTMKAAVEAAKQKGARLIVVAAPVGDLHAVHMLRQIADRVVCAFIPVSFYAVSEWYGDFRQVPDAEVCRLLNEAQDNQSSSETAAGS